MKVVFYLNLMPVTEMKDHHPSRVEIPNSLFPIAQADITECSTYAVVCRLKSSPIYTITSSGGSFIHPDFPGVAFSIPENAIDPNAEFPLELKVDVFTNLRPSAATLN